ncbi:MAG: hypothetical protein KGH56_01980 [Patescibacteria group bacterium]|nr:hypothetical protein [Patescibacteria group bacterium]
MSEGIPQKKDGEFGKGVFEQALRKAKRLPVKQKGKEHGARKKESSRDEWLEAVIAKISSKEKPVGVDFLNALRDAAEQGASPEKIQHIWGLASQRLDKKMFDQLKGLVPREYWSQSAEMPEKPSVPEKEPVADDQSSKEEDIKAPPAAEGISPEDKEEKLPEPVQQEPVVEPQAAAAVKAEPAAQTAEAASAAPQEDVDPSQRMVKKLAEDIPDGERTRAELYKKLRELIEGAEKKTSEGHERLKTYLAGRSEALQKKVEEYRPKMAKMVFPFVAATIHLGRDVVRLGERMSRRGERLVEYLGERKEALKKVAKEYGPKAQEISTSVLDRYNKLDWKTKLAITGTLMAGVAYSPVAVPALSAALYGQRALGGASMFMNRRKALDAEITRNPEHWLAGKSEITKNTYVAALAAVYAGATSFAVHEGVEGLRAVANSELLSDGIDRTKAAMQEGAERLRGLANNRWLDKMLGHQDVVSTPEIPEPSDQIGSRAAPPEENLVTQEELEKLRIEEIAAEEKRAAEEMVSSAGLEQPHPSAPPPMEDAPFGRDPVTGEALSQSGAEKLAASLAHPEQPPSIESLRAETDSHIATAEEHLANIQKLAAEQQAALGESKEVSPDAVLPAEEASAAEAKDRFKDIAEKPLWSGGEGHLSRIEGTPLQEQAAEAASFVENNHSEVVKFQSLDADGNVVDKLAYWDGKNVAIEIDPNSAPQSETHGAPFGRDASGLPFSSEQEAKDFEDLKRATVDPRTTGEWPGSHSTQTPEGISGQTAPATIEAAAPLAGFEVPAAEAHIYATDSKDLFVHGGSWEKQGPLIQQYLEAHPKETVYSADMTGKHRIPWSLVDGRMTPGTPVRTGGFFGFGSSWAEAPDPKEFIKIIK